MAEFAELFVGVPPELAFTIGVSVALMTATEIAWSIIRLLKKKKPL